LFGLNWIYLIFRGDETISADNYVSLGATIIEKKWTGKEEL
jgi:hypothetical protein